MLDDQPQQTAAASRPMRPVEVLGTALRLYRRRWRTLLPIVALAVPLAISLPSTRTLPAGDEYQVVVHHRVVATGGSWADTAIVVLAMLALALGIAVVAGAVTRAALAAAAAEDISVRGATGSRPAGCGRCSG
jgi:hypothetical protein